MKLFLPILLSSAALAQTPASSNVLGSEYPKLFPDGHAMFRITAPQARSVAVELMGTGAPPFTMSVDDKGVWTVTTPVIAPGFHYYAIVIDGVRTNDPGSQTFFGYARETSGIDVPDPSATFYEVRNVPHGEVRVLWYTAKTTGQTRRIFVYVPPGYDQDLKRRYPVLYLQHGSGESERGWTLQGCANFIADNLLAEKNAQPFLIVMENGYGVGRSNEAFEKIVVDDLVPFIDAKFRTEANARGRAMAGLSMGGGQALAIAAAHPETFASVASLSGAARSFDVEKFKRPLRLFWIGCGTEDRLFEGSKKIHEQLTAAKITHEWWQAEGTHEWQTWRKHFYDLAQKLFR